jgi:aerobic carbon-monoxide dehydrogenase medium subunit
LLPPKFDYSAPRTSDEALSLLEQHGREAKLLAGGQSLIPLMKLRFASPSLLVDINHVDGLGDIDESNGELRLGTLVRHEQLATSPLLKQTFPLIAATAPWIADPISRSLGTVGGSLAHADPAGDWGSVMLALGASVVAKTTSGERTIAIKDFFRGPFRSTLEPTEMLTEVLVPKAGANSGGTYLKLERKVGDFATVGVAVQLELDGDTIRRAGIGLTAVGPKNIEASAAEDSLAGAQPTAQAFDEAAQLAADASDPIDDVRGSAAYKRAVVRAYVRRGLDRALELARDGGS